LRFVFKPVKVEKVHVAFISSGAADSEACLTSSSQIGCCQNLASSKPRFFLSYPNLYLQFIGRKFAEYTMNDLIVSANIPAKHLQSHWIAKSGEGIGVC
jgi:hypothetical protein